MPPKRKVLRFHCHCRSTKCSDTNPLVVLQPLMRDVSSQRKYRFTALPASALLYNKPDTSDLKLIVGENCYYAHRNLLSAASEIFATMLNENWSERNANELVLHEDPECAKVFERFLYFIYSGNIVLSESYVVPLFMLADKYNIKNLYDECIKVIENGLKVFMVPEYRIERPSTSFQHHYSPAIASSASSSDSSDSSDFFDIDTIETPLSVPEVTIDDSFHISSPSLAADSNKTKMVASETFPVSLVLKMLLYCHNDRIHRAALFNLEARVGNQICQGNYSAIWNDLEVELVVKILADSRFCYPEYSLFEATKEWLLVRDERETPQTIEMVLSQIRFPLLTTTQLYNVMKDGVVKKSQKIITLIEEAIKYKLFVDCCTSDDKEKWSGPQFEPRRPLP